MARFRVINVLILLLALLCIAAPAAQAAQSYDNCTGFIASLPAVITTQGTWCFNKDLNTAVTSGSAIDIQTNNVTIDCNGFKLGGLAAGLGTLTTGIHALQRSNLIVRNCNIRGFVVGLYFDSLGDVGGGQVVEDNRFNGNTAVGLSVEGDGSVVRRNQIVNTGGSTAVAFTYGLVTFYSVDVLDNTVSGVAATSGGNGNVDGIFTQSDTPGDLGESVNGNRIRSLVPDGTGIATGISNSRAGRVIMRNNDLIGVTSAGSVGVACTNSIGNAKDNVISGFATAIDTCTDSGNAIIP
jgi:hypothetical protein